MSEIVDQKLWAHRSAMQWSRLREVILAYQVSAPIVDEPRMAAADISNRHFLADVVSMLSDIGESRHLEMDLALAARDAGVKIRTGVLRCEQEWAAGVPPIPTGHPSETTLQDNHNQED